MGKIASTITDAVEQKTPLQQKLAQYGRTLTLLVLGICALMFGVSVVGGIALDSFSTLHAGVSLAVAAIPEDWRRWSISVYQWCDQNVKAPCNKKAHRGRGPGLYGIICSDKTGTLTQNKMTVVSIWPGRVFLAASFALCSGALDRATESAGDPTQAAVVDYAYRWGFEIRLDKVSADSRDSLDSGRKLMTWR